ncbi:DUF4292 domain-containing protein [Flavobacterium aciduliphilum]|uniref:Uncharacterized protein DUF4292 n=1 Tax=Flavobacterium aciduliphilum TaxID=1101402 RepID=A0A328YHR6_9FLAO|nr:DUF4292 domain-containing protein [Flavobacterium aciduliphilum]RAR72834.1 uncharacterized protein DUF4292 [Flavobacterium aciduliphilum]
MKKYIVLLVVLLASCKPKAILLESQKPIVDESTITVDKISEKNQENNIDFSTLNIKANAQYDDEKNAQNVTAEIRIKKDEKILVIIRVLGITMAKGLITPTSVQYYEKIGNKYFEGDYQGLSKWLGTDLDFQKVQNMFIGKTFESIKKGAKYQVSVNNQQYQLKKESETNTETTFLFENEHFLLKQQEISQPQNNRLLQVNYANYQKINNRVLPTLLQINAHQNETKTTLSIEYKNIQFNEDLTFPYNVPDRFERVYIEKN